MVTVRAKGRRGRPREGTARVSREALVTAALALLERGGAEAVTMRAIARELSVDPMAAYHYFSSKDELLAEAAQHAYASFSPRLPRSAPVERRLLALGRAYARFVALAPELVRYAAARPFVARASSSTFDAAFARAVAGASLDESLMTAGRDALVDLVHGHVLTTGHAEDAALARELAIVCAGLVALSASGRRAPRPTQRRRR